MLSRRGKQPSSSSTPAVSDLNGLFQVPAEGSRMFASPRPLAAPGTNPRRLCARQREGSSPHSGGEPRDFGQLIGQLEFELLAIRVRDCIEQGVRARLVACKLDVQLVEQCPVRDGERDR